MWELNALPLPDRWPAWFSASATPASVWSFSRESSRAMMPGGVCAGAVVVVLGLTQAPQGLVPVGLQCVGHQPVARVHAEVAPAGQLRMRLSALHVGSPQPVRLTGPGLELGLDAEGDLQGQGGEGVEQERRDGLVDTVPGDDLAAPHPCLDGLGHAPVLRVLDTTAGVVADGHVPAAVPAD